MFRKDFRGRFNVLDLFCVIRNEGEWEGLTYMRWVFLSCCSKGLWMKIFCYCKTLALGLWMDNPSTPPNAHPFAEFIDFLGMEIQKRMKKFTSRLCDIFVSSLLVASSEFSSQSHLTTKHTAKAHTALCLLFFPCLR